MISRLIFLGQYNLWSSTTFIFLFGGLGGLVGRLINGITDWLRAGMESLLDKLFAVAIEAFLLIDNPYGVSKANEAWMNSFEVALAIFPVMIIMGLLSMPFADEKKTSLWRQGLRIVGVIAIIAVSRPLIGFGVDLSNAMTVALMPTGSDLMTMLLPGDSMMSSLASTFSALAIVLLIYFLGVYMAIALGVVLILLQLRIFFIYLVFISSPILAVFWYADWGMMESVSEFANKWARMGIYTLLSGPIIAIIFRTMFVIGSGALVEGADGAAEGVAAFWSHFVLVTCFPIIMIAAVWKIVSWAGEPIGAGQAMTGMSMAFGAAAGAMVGSVAGEGAAAAGTQSGQQAASAGGAGSPGGGGGGTASSSGGGLAGSPGSASAAGPGNGQGRLADAVSDQDSGTVSATDSAAASSSGAGPAATSASGSGTVAKGGVEGDIPGGTGGSDGPSDDVTGAGSPPASEEPKGYINAAKERYGNFKERNAAAMDQAVSNYKETAKDRLNPTNIERKRGEMKRQQAAGLEQGQQQFEESIDMSAGDHGSINLEQAEASGALRDSVKATNYDTAEPATASLSEDGSFEYRNENDEMVQGSIGAKNQQFRDQQETLREEADMHDDRADRIDQSMSETGARLKKTGGNVRSKYGPAMQEARHAFGREAVRGTVGAHSPYLMAGGSGVFGGGQRGGGAAAAGAGPGGPEAEAKEAAGAPESSVSAETAMEHQDLLNESGERFDVSDREYGFEPGGGRTPEGVSQQGYLTNPETGDRVSPVEVSEDSGVSLSSDESFKLGNVGMGKRDGESPQSLPGESGEYGTISVDEHSRTYDDGEVRADQVIGNSEMIGEDATLKNHTIRESPGEPENYEGQYFAESPNGERIPINASDEEANEALGDMVGQKADLSGTIENQYGMSKDTHPEYEGAHDYNAMNISLGDEDAAGAPEGASDSGGDSGDNNGGTAASATTASATGTSSHSIAPSSGPDSGNSSGGSSSESSSNGHGVTSTSGSSTNSSSGHDSGGSETVDAAELTGERMDQAEKMWDYPDNADVSIPDDARYEYQPEAATHETQKSKGSFKLLNGDEISGDAPDRIGAIAFNGGEIKDENGNVQLNDRGEPKTMPEDGDWGFDQTPGNTNPVIEGQDFNDVQARHFYDSQSEHSHEHAGEMAAEHGGEADAYLQIRPSDATDMSGHSHTGAGDSAHGSSPPSDDPTGAATSRQEGTSPDGSVPESPELEGAGEPSTSSSSGSGESHSSSFTPASGEHIENATGGNETSNGEDVRTPETESEGETTSHSSESTINETTSEASRESPDHGEEIELSGESLTAGEGGNANDLHGERVDAHGVGRSTVLDDAAIGSAEEGSESEVMLADDTRENSRAEYGEGKLEGVNHGDSFAVKNAEVHSPDEQGADVLRMDEDTEVEPTESHEGPATMSVGSERGEFQSESGSGGSEGATEVSTDHDQHAAESSSVEHTSHDASEEGTEHASGDHTERVNSSPEIEKQTDVEVEVDDTTERAETHNGEQHTVSEVTEEAPEVEPAHSSGGDHSGSDSGGGEATRVADSHSGGSHEADHTEDIEISAEDSEREPESGETGPDHSAVSSHQVEAGEEIEEVEKNEESGSGGESGESEASGEGGASASHSGGEDSEEGGDEDHPLNPGSGASAAGEHSGEDVSEDDWGDYAQNWRDHHDESETETLGEHDGFTAESMHVETLGNGEKAYITDYDDLEESIAEEDIMGQPRAEELKHQSLVGHEWSEAMGQEMPNVTYNEEENEVIQQEAGGADTETWGINEAPDEVLEQVDRDDYEETMAVQLLGGNLDTSEDNVHVDEDGGLHVIDFDRTASSMGEVDNTDELEINAGPAARIGHKIGKVNEDFHTDKFQYEEELAQKSVDMATKLEANGETDDVLAGVEELDEAHSGASEPRAPVIRHNIETLSEEEVEMNKSRGASDEDIAEAFEDLESDDEE